MVLREGRFHGARAGLPIAHGGRARASCFNALMVLMLALMTGACTARLPADDTTARAAIAAAVQPSVIAGQVLDVTGRPVEGALIRALPTADLQSLVGNQAAGRRTASLETRTGPDGRFALEMREAGPLNVEAVRSDREKAIQLGVTGNGAPLSLTLAPTGTIQGRVVAPDAPDVTDFEGVDVFVPGTSYLAKTDSRGQYVLADMPAGRFPLVARSDSLGRALVKDVVVEPGKATSAPDLPMTLKAPVISSIVPQSGGPGTQVLLSGKEFGASAGKAFIVAFGSVIATRVQRVGDQAIRVTVPQAARKGEVVVLVNGVPSNPVAFNVISRLALLPGHLELASGEQQGLDVEAYDTDGKPVASPSITLESAGAAVVLEGRTLKAVAAGTASVRILSGSVADTALVTVHPRSPQVTTIAGNGDSGLTDGPGATARFNGPTGIVVASDGTSFVCEYLLPVLRSIDPSGVVTTVAGSQDYGRLDGPPGSARFTGLGGVCLDRSGNLLFTDLGNAEGYGAIRRISAVDGTVSTLAGSPGLMQPGLYEAVFRDGATSSARFNQPTGLLLMPDDSILVADTANHRIRRVTPDGVVSTVAGNGRASLVDGVGEAASLFLPVGLALHPDGHVLIADQGNHCVRRLDLDGTVRTVAGNGLSGLSDRTGQDARFNSPYGLVCDGAGDCYVADTGNHLIRRVTREGHVSTVAGGAAGHLDGAARTARLFGPIGIALEPGGKTLVFTDFHNRRIRRLVLAPEPVTP